VVEEQVVEEKHDVKDKCDAEENQKVTDDHDSIEDMDIEGAQNPQHVAIAVDYGHNDESANHGASMESVHTDELIQAGTDMTRDMGLGTGANISDTMSDGDGIPTPDSVSVTDEEWAILPSSSDH
jgi:hypothetical protein